MRAPLPVRTERLVGPNPTYHQRPLVPPPQLSNPFQNFGGEAEDDGGAVRHMHMMLCVIAYVTVHMVFYGHALVLCWGVLPHTFVNPHALFIHACIRKQQQYRTIRAWVIYSNLPRSCCSPCPQHLLMKLWQHACITTSGWYVWGDGMSGGGGCMCWGCCVACTICCV